MPAPMWTEGPSRPRAIPLASDVEEQTNFPKTVAMKCVRLRQTALFSFEEFRYREHWGNSDKEGIR
jgi:hypothetical protein